jgi:protein TonB
MVWRYAVTGVVAVGVTFGLVLLMYGLITTQEGRVTDQKLPKVIDFVRLKREAEVETKKRELPQLASAEAAPPPPDLGLSNRPAPAANGGGAAVLPIEAPKLALDGPGLAGGAGGDTDVTPLVRIAPQYPLQAAERRIQGWVVVEFTISAAGTVMDPQVIASDPPSVFDGAALQAVRKWKYKPKVVDGTAVERPGVKVKLDFKLKDATAG